MLGSEPSSVESVDLLSGVKLVSGVEPEPSPEESLGLQSSGSYLLCLSCSFLLLVSASLSTFCSSLALQ